MRRRHAFFSLRLTHEELDALRAQAAELGISVSDLLRRSPGQVATIKIGLSEYLSRWEPLNESELRAAVSMVQRIVDV